MRKRRGGFSALALAIFSVALTSLAGPAFGGADTFKEDRSATAASITARFQPSTNRALPDRALVSTQWVRCQERSAPGTPGSR